MENLVSTVVADIYWKPLKKHQENSGRGYVVLNSSEDAKKLEKHEYTAKGRILEINQVHPEEMRKFCNQCEMPIHHELSDPYPEEFLKNLEEEFNLISSEAKETESVKFKPDESSNCVVTEDLEGVTVSPIAEKESTTKEKDSKGNASNKEPDSKKDSRITGEEEKKRDIQNLRLKQALKEINEKPWEPPRIIHHHPPPPQCAPPLFNPTVFVRMYNVPDKTTTLDIRNFFAPVLPAKIAQNIGYDIYDIEFYNPDDAWISMRKHLLLIRKNSIHLEMLPGPPHPLPPRPEQPPRPLSPGPGPAPPMNRPPNPMHPDFVNGHVPPGTYPAHGLNMRPMHPVYPGPMGPPPMHPNAIPRPVHPMVGGPPREMPPHPMPLGMMPHPPPGEFRPDMPPPMHPRDRMPPGPPPGARHGSPERMRPPHMVDPHYRPYDDYHPPRPEPQPNVRHEVPHFREEPNPAWRDRPPQRPETRPEKIEKTEEVQAKKEVIPVPPLPKNFEEYEVPPFNPDTPVGQAVITPMQGYFCQLCNKFYSSLSSAQVAHCKSRGHYDKLKQFLREKKKLRKLAQASL